MKDMRAGTVLPMPFDAHVHLRQGRILKHVLPATARDFGRAIVMPNTKPAVWNADTVRAYREEILECAPHGFEPLMTIYLTQQTTPEVILAAGKAGAVAAKFYPKHGTTNSDDGLVPEFFLAQSDWFAALEEAGMVMCIHAEHPKHIKARREHEFLKLFVDSRLPERFPKLRFVIEHVSTAYGLQVVSESDNVAGSVTAHHLVLTDDDVMGNHLNLCMPVAKSARDRSALREAVFQGNSPRIFFGSDSAPHQLSAKSKPEGSYGIYTAPIALKLLAQEFANASRSNNLSSFVSSYGPAYYRLPEEKRVIEVVAEPFHVLDPRSEPALMEPVRDPSAEVDEDAKTDPPPPGDRLTDPIIPFYAGRAIHWSVRYDR